MLILGCGASLQILRQRRPSRVQIHKSIVSFLRQLHLLSQHIAKHLKIYLFINLCTHTHTHTYTYVRVCLFFFILHMFILYALLASKPKSLKFQTPPRVRPQWTFSTEFLSSTDLLHYSGQETRRPSRRDEFDPSRGPKMFPRDRLE